jgi:hypothetical protein
MARSSKRAMLPQFGVSNPDISRRVRRVWTPNWELSGNRLDPGWIELCGLGELCGKQDR